MRYLYICPGCKNGFVPENNKKGKRVCPHCGAACTPIKGAAHSLVNPPAELYVSRAIEDARRVVMLNCTNDTLNEWVEREKGPEYYAWNNYHADAASNAFVEAFYATAEALSLNVKRPYKNTGS